MVSQNNSMREKPIPGVKLDLVNELAEKIKSHRTVLVASCKGLPGKQFHDIKKKMRGKAEVKVAKKGAVIRAIKMTEKGALQQLSDEISADFAIFFSDIDPFELSGLLTESQSSRKAKGGDIAPEDIVIEPGPTDLVPGPAISELSGVGLKVSVKEGKLEIMKGATVAKKGETITPQVASVLGKLNVNPIKVGFIPLTAYDSNEDKVYVGIRIDKKATLEELKESIKKSLGFAINIKFPTEKTIRFFLAKAAMEEKALARLSGNSEEKKEENSGEDNAQNQATQDTREEA
jgi:large subunit ribosomal protein L10